ncbi:MAG: hypothetical protein M1828_000200 [Chrysothrix sp. TS-e1954]|nr:MAG: hypothetical protein M1828_000200 [Chrysothrix sp. TS-e1954]
MSFYTISLGLLLWSHEEEIGTLSLAMRKPYSRENCLAIALSFTLVLLYYTYQSSSVRGSKDASGIFRGSGFLPAYGTSLSGLQIATSDRSGTEPPIEKATSGAFRTATMNVEKMSISKALIVASLTSDDTQWLHEYFPQWTRFIYKVDNASARLTVPRNKGREWSAYLSYIIDNYDRLPEVSVFLHGERYQWHNEDPMYDGVLMISKLRLEHVIEQGYANLRCTHAIGCPVELRPLDRSMLSTYSRDRTQAVYARSLRELEPNITVPSAIGVPCGSQFGLDRSTIRSRPKSDYVRYRKWLYAADLDDEISGRVLEYAWHIIVGKDGVHCPTASTCFCGLYGLCDLACSDVGSCQGRFKLPKYAKMPVGWPEDGPGRDGWPESRWWETL